MDTFVSFEFLEIPPIDIIPNRSDVQKDDEMKQLVNADNVDLYGWTCTIA